MWVGSGPLGYQWKALLRMIHPPFEREVSWYTEVEISSILPTTQNLRLVPFLFGHQPFPLELGSYSGRGYRGAA